MSLTTFPHVLKTFWARLVETLLFWLFLVHLCLLPFSWKCTVFEKSETKELCQVAIYLLIKIFWNYVFWEKWCCEKYLVLIKYSFYDESSLVFLECWMKRKIKKNEGVRIYQYQLGKSWSYVSWKKLVLFFCIYLNLCCCEKKIGS